MNDQNCIFCKIANGEIPSATVYEDEEFRVILDMGPASRGHALILPKSHFKDITEADMETAGKLFPLASKIGQGMKKGLGAAGFNVVQNNGTCAGQTVFHLHVHVIPRYEGGPEIVAWKPGKSDPDELAKTAALIHAAVTEN
ncbi:MAG: HIT family protein [Clostridiales bacterium]|nr:HIT family protein [Clostridiales bacterium]